MTERPFDRISDKLRAVSDRAEDMDWVQTAFGVLISERVRPSRAESAVNGCIRTISETGTGAQELYGAPATWAHEKVAGWEEKGTAAFEDEKPLSAWDITFFGLFSGAVISVLFWLYCALSKENSSYNLMVLSVLLGFVLMSVPAAYQRVKLRFGHLAAVLSASAAALTGSLALALFLQTMSGINRALAPWWHLVLAALLIALALAFYKLVPEPGKAPDETHYDPTDERAWLNTLRTELYKRKDFSDARVREELALVQAHARDAGSTLDEEFGHPATYASGLAGQSVVEPYRLMLYAVMVLGIHIYWFYLAVTATDGSTWWRIPLGMVVLLASIASVSKSWGTYREQRQRTSTEG